MTPDEIIMTLSGPQGIGKTRLALELVSILTHKGYGIVYAAEDIHIGPEFPKPIVVIRTANAAPEKTNGPA